MLPLALLFGAIAITGLAAIAGIALWGVWIVLRAFVDLTWGDVPRCWTPDLDAFQQGPADMVGR